MNAVETGNKEKSKENKPPGDEDDGNVDVGVLLGESSELHPIRRLRTDIHLSEPAIASSIAPADFSVERPAFIEIDHSTTDTPTHLGNGHPSPGTVC
jgi:hypothetical protein